MSDTDETPARPTNVIEAIAAVMRDLPPIGKDSEVKGDGPSYKFRGIEAITAAAQKLCGKHCVVFVPRVVGMESREVSVGSRGAVWDEYTVTVEYDVFGPGGVSDCLPTPVRVVQLGRDNSDKGIAKAMTMAYKTALNQVFCIGDSKNDSDSERHENADRDKGDWYVQNGWKGGESEHDANRNALVGFLAELDSGVQAKFKERRQQAEIDLRQALTRAEFDTLTSFLSELGYESPGAESDENDSGPSDPPESDTTAHGAAQSESEDSVGADDAASERALAEVARVRALKPAEVTAELEARGLDVDGSTDAQRKRLVASVLKEQVATIGAEG